MHNSDNGNEKLLNVMMITEGSYPFHYGGVSTWCHILIRDLPEIDFTLVSLVSSPGVKLQFPLPANVVEFRPIPLWGIHAALETRRELTLAEIRERQHQTTETVIVSQFIPSFSTFLAELFVDEGDPVRLARQIHQMYRFFRSYDFDTALHARVTWDCFVQMARRYFPHVVALHGYPRVRLSLADMTLAMHWLCHWLIPLARPLPCTNVVHAAMAGLCSLVAIAAKLEYGAVYLLTEHGVYLRERYLAEAESANSLFLKIFSLRFARRITEMSYALADQVSPANNYNQRWERRNGVHPDRLQTIYTGVDPAAFVPAGKPVGEPPVVVWVGRINPLKDLITLIRAAALVHQSRPDIQFRLYGSAPTGNEAYFKECLALRSELGLEEAVVFTGYASRPEIAFNEGDVVLLSSISEGFPLSVVEAMLCGKPVVGTAVGGVREAIEGCGIPVEPRNPEEMAQAILTLMNDPARCAALGRAAREKAMRYFTLRQTATAYQTSYRRLVENIETFSVPVIPAPTDETIIAVLGTQAAHMPRNGHEQPPTELKPARRRPRLTLAHRPKVV